MESTGFRPGPERVLLVSNAWFVWKRSDFNLKSIALVPAPLVPECPSKKRPRDREKTASGPASILGLRRRPERPDVVILQPAKRTLVSWSPENLLNQAERMFRDLIQTIALIDSMHPVSTAP